MDRTDFIVLIVIVLMILIVVYPTILDRRFRARAKREGVIAEATITRKSTNRSRLSLYYGLEYSYLTYERLEYVKPDGYQAVEVGDKIKIVYLFSNPQDARIIDPRVKGENFQI